MPFLFLLQLLAHYLVLLPVLLLAVLRAVPAAAMIGAGKQQQLVIGAADKPREPRRMAARKHREELVTV